MSDDDAPPKPNADFDVMMIRGPTEDGQGVRVLRARPGRLDAGEVSPLRDGKPLVGGEIVRLEPRSEAPGVYDVHVEDIRSSPPVGESKALQPRKGPAQIATAAYHAGWLSTFRRAEKPN
jgi:hypothetical protein